MPRLDHRAQVEELPYEVRLVLTLLLDELNLLRQRAGLQPRTPAQVRDAVRDYRKAHPRPTRQGG